jgi:hypothetical protein
MASIIFPALGIIFALLIFLGTRRLMRKIEQAESNPESSGQRRKTAPKPQRQSERPDD